MKTNKTGSILQCPFCNYNASSVEALVNHFRDYNERKLKPGHPYKYLRKTYNIEPKRKIRVGVYTGANELIGYNENKDPYKYKMKAVPFETNRHKH